GGRTTEEGRLDIERTMRTALGRNDNDEEVSEEDSKENPEEDPSESSNDYIGE
ncbi:hypothetical protein PanWU01x14_236000, partial [Parasponia andersonii]